MSRLVIVGASGHGKVVADIAFRCGYDDVLFLDDGANVCECAGLPVVGCSSDACEMKDATTDFFVAVGNADARQRIQDSLVAGGCSIATLVHPAACISRRVTIGMGSVVMAGAVVNSDTVIGDGCIVNTGATVDHDCRIGDYAHVSVGAHLAGTVHVGYATWVGAGAVISNNISICDSCMIGAGAVVVRDIAVAGTYVGVPAKRV